MYCINRVDNACYERVSDETLDSLSEVLEELIESDEAPPDSDVLYSVCIRTHAYFAGTLPDTSDCFSLHPFLSNSPEAYTVVEKFLPCSIV